MKGTFHRMSRKRRDAAEREAQRRAAERAARPAIEPEPEPEPDAREVARMIRGGNNRWDALRALNEAVRLEAAARRRRDRAVLRARQMGATWTDIGRVLGVTPQAAGQRYGRRVADDQGPR